VGYFPGLTSSSSFALSSWLGGVFHHLDVAALPPQKIALRPVRPQSFLVVVPLETFLTSSLLPGFRQDNKDLDKDQLQDEA
jgi:hypothetical protein